MYNILIINSFIKHYLKDNTISNKLFFMSYSFKKKKPGGVNLRKTEKGNNKSLLVTE